MNMIRNQLPYTLDEFDAKNLGQRYKGKVRENFHLDNEPSVLVPSLANKYLFLP